MAAYLQSDVANVQCPLVWQADTDIIRYGRFAITRLDYRKESYTKVSVCGLGCEFSDMRIERGTSQRENISMRLPGIMVATVAQ